MRVPPADPSAVSTRQRSARRRLACCRAESRGSSPAVSRQLRRPAAGMRSRGVSTPRPAPPLHPRLLAVDERSGHLPAFHCITAQCSCAGATMKPAPVMALAPVRGVCTSYTGTEASERDKGWSRRCAEPWTRPAVVCQEGGRRGDLSCEATTPSASCTWRGTPGWGSGLWSCLEHSGRCINMGDTGDGGGSLCISLGPRRVVSAVIKIAI